MVYVVMAARLAMRHGLWLAHGDRYAIVSNITANGMNGIKFASSKEVIAVAEPRVLWCSSSPAEI